MNAYSVAEWLAHNANDIRAELVGKYIKARGMERPDAILYIHDVLYNHFCMTYPEHDNDETMLAFQDERVMIVMDRYFTKEFYYEH